MPYATGPYSLFTSLPAPARGSLSSSRKIDFAKRDYVIDDDGGFEAMDDTVQRVVLLVAFAVSNEKFVTEKVKNAEKDRITKALSILTDGSEPVIRLINVSVTDSATGRIQRKVEFHNLKTGTKKTVQL